MKRIRSASFSLTLIACVGMLIPPAAWGESPVARQQNQRVLDVSLHQGGLLVGQVVNPQGMAQESVEVAIVRDGRELARAKTDNLGRFAINGLTGGAYQLATSGSQLPVRAWSKDIAPPNSAVGAMLVDGPTVRGQCSTCNSGNASGGYVNGGAASFNHGGYGGNVSDAGVTSFNQGGYGGGVSDAGVTSFNQGGYGDSVSGGVYDTGVVTSSDAGYVTSGDTASVVTSGDAGASYGSTGGHYDGSNAVGGASGYVDGGAYGGGGYAAGGYSHGGVAAGSTGGGLLGGGIFGGTGFLSSPWVIGAGVAAAIAIPVALDDDDAS